MAISGNAELHEMCKLVTGLAPITPSSSTPDYVCLKGYAKCTIIILVDNATTVTGSEITIKQAKDVGATGEKAVSFSTVYANTDTGASDTLVSTAVTSNKFTTDTTNDKNLMYVMTVGLEDLDLANDFDCVRAGTADATSATLSVLYVLYPAPYGASANVVPTAITDPSV